ncbi:MAG TPA: hypothetical protein VG166_14500 [Caulobacteraceae bacterium]|nr:hypothetical protein [Caulobacteraceae bacterium]
MITKLLVAGAAIAALSCGAATAHARHHHHLRHSGLTYAAPPQPIPYAQLDSYLRGSSRERMAIGASTGVAADTSASAGTAYAPPSAPGAANPTTSVTASPNPNAPTDQMNSTGSEGNTAPPPPTAPNGSPQ